MGNTSKSKYASQWEEVRKKKKEEEEKSSSAKTTNSSKSSNKYESQWAEVRKQRIANTLNSMLEDYNNSVSSAQDRFKNVNSYRGDTADYLSQVEGYRNNYTTKKSEIDALLKQYKGYYDDDFIKAVNSTFADLDSGYEGLYKNASADHDYFSQFADENAYKGAQDNQTYSKKYAKSSYADLQKAKADIEAKLTKNKDDDALNRELYWLQNHDRDIQYVDSMSDDDLSNLQADYDSNKKTLEAEKAKLQKEITEIKNKAGRASPESWSGYKEKVARIQEIDEQLAQESPVLYYDDVGAVTVSDTLRDREHEVTFNAIKGNADHQAAYDNALEAKANIEELDVKSRDLQEQIRRYETEGHVPDALIAELNSVESAIAKNKKVIEDFNSLGYDFDELEHYNRTKESRANYLVEQQKDAEYATEHPVKATLKSIGTAPASIVELVGNLVDTAQYGYSNVYDDKHINQNATYTGTVGQNINDYVMDKTNSEILSWLASGAYSGVTSSVQSALTTGACTLMFGAAGAPIALGIMGTEAAASSYNSAIMNGSTNGEAILTATASGIAEALFEKVSLDKLLDIGKMYDVSSMSALLKSMIKNSGAAFVQGGVEASEEFFTEITNKLADEIINGDHSSYNTAVAKYKKMGYSDADAKEIATKDAINDVLSALYGGFIGGMGSGAGASLTQGTRATGMAIGNEILSNQYYNQMGKNVVTNEGVQDLVGKANGSSSLRKLANKVAGVNTTELTDEKGVKKYEKQVGKLYKGVTESQLKELSKTNASETEVNSFTELVKEELKSKGVDNVDKVAEVIVKSALNDGKLTREESIIYNSANGRQVIHNVLRSEDLKVDEGSSLEQVKNEINSTRELGKFDAANAIKRDLLDKTDYKISSDGVTTIEATDEAVDSMRITSLDGDDITLEVKVGDNHHTVVAGEMSLNQDYAVIFEGLKNIKNKFGLDESTANQILTLWEGHEGDSFKFSKAIEEGFMYGQYNMRTEFENSAFAEELSEETRNLVFELGREYKQKVTDEKNASAQKEAKADIESKVTFAEGVSYNNLNESQKAQVDMAQVIAHTFGFNLEVFRSPKNALGRSIGENGSYSASTNTMRLDIDAGTLDGKSLILFTQAHELTHYIKKWSPEKYKVFADFLVEKYAEKDVPLKKLIQQKINESKIATEADKTGRHHVLTFDEAFDEVVCNACEDFLADPDIQQTILEISKVDQGIAQKIKDFIKNLINRLDKALRGLQGESLEAEFVRGLDAEDIQQLKDLWLVALIDSRENVVQARKRTTEATKNTTDEGDVFSDREDVSERYMDETIKSFNISDIEDCVHVQKQVFNTLLNENFFEDENLRRRLDVNLDSEMVIETNKSGIDETFAFNNYKRLGKSKKVLKLATIRKLPEIIKNGELLSDNISDSHKNAKNKKFAYIKSTVEIDGREVLVKLDIKKSPQKNKFWVHRVDIIKEANDSPTITDKVMRQGDNVIDSTEIIHNPTGKVKSNDEQTTLLGKDTKFHDRDADVYSRISEMQLEVNKLRKSIADIESSDEFKEEQRKLSEAFSNDIDGAIELYTKWLKESEYGKLKSKKDAMEEELNKLRTEYSNQARAKALEEEENAIAKSGLSEADYFRKQAIKEFGYTPYFYDAGYITPNGKMLNFSGEKGKHFGSRGEDHRAIGIIYAETQGTDALNRFMKDGNIRIMAESPGLDISTLVEPTKEQYSTIRKFVSEYAKREFFNVDLSDESGKVIGSLEYEGRINPTRVINDIKHYYATGEIREQSSVEKFLFQDRDSIGRELSPEQAEFFKDSKVRDADGRLIPVYHGTFEDFTVFDFDKTSDINNLGKGHYFTNSKDDAEYNYASEDGPDVRGKIESLAFEYFSEMGYSEEDLYDNSLYGEYDKAYDKAASEYEKGKVITTYLNITNPLYVSEGGSLYNSNGEKIDNFTDEYDGFIDKYVSQRFGMSYTDESTVHYVVFNSNQIKAVNNLNPTENEDIRYQDRVTPEQDAEYLELAKNPEANEARLREMVDEAAKKTGYTRRLYHGTASKFNVFGFGRSGIFTTDNFDMAKTYGDNVMSLYGRQGANVLEIDAKNNPHYAIPVDKEILDFSEYPLMRGKELYSTNDISRIAFAKGFDVVVIENVYDNFNFMSENKASGLGIDVIYKDSNQVKSADLVTYDDNGDIVPLSERFNEGNEDIRFQDRVYDGSLTQERIDYLIKDSGAKFNIGYANTWIASINPSDFIDLTLRYETRNKGREVFDTKVEGDYGSVMGDRDYISDLKNSREIPYLCVDMDTGKVIGHNGRHRMRALEKTGATRTPIGIKFYKNDDLYKGNYDGVRLETIDAMRLTSQFDDKFYSQYNAYIHDIIPLNEDHRDEIEKAYRAKTIDVKYGFSIAYQDRPYQPTLEDLGIDFKEENERLKADVERLEEMLKLQGTVTHGKALATKAYEGVAKKFLHEFGMKRVTDKEVLDTFVKKLDKFYCSIIDADELAWEKIFNDAQEIAEWVDSKIVEKPKRIDYADEILKEIRSIKISLDDAQMQEVAYAYGSYNAFRKSSFGRINLSNDGIKLDSQWSEWANAYPFVFDADTNSADMPTRLVEIINDLKTAYEVTEEYDKAEQIRSMATAIYDSYWDIPTVRTLADKHQKEVNLLKSKHKAEMDALKEKKDAKLKDTKAYYQEMVKKVRADKDAKMEAYKERTQKQIKKNLEGRTKTATKNKIKRVVKTLESLYNNPTKERNVKIEFQDMVNKALIMADAIFDSGNISAYDVLSGKITISLGTNEKKKLEEWRKIQEARQGYQNRLDALESSSSKDINPNTYDELLKMISKCNSKLNVLGRELSDVVERQKAELNNNSVQNAIDSLVEAYKSLDESTESYVKAAYNDYVATRLETLKESLKGTTAKTMSLTQLDELYQAYKMVLTSVRTANELFVKNKRLSVVDVGESVIREVQKVAKITENKIGMLNELRGFSWQELKPVYAFERIGSQTFMDMYKEVLRGQGIFARDIEDSKDFFNDKGKAYGYDSWDTKARKDFKLADGRIFSLSLQEIMSIYAYSKREQALDHITDGGFVFDTKEFFTDNREKGLKGKIKKQRTTVKAYRLNIGEFQQIINSLTKEQKKFVDDMQDYLSSVMGAKGNEVSRVLYGIDLFKEKYYFPLMSSHDFITQTNNPAGEVALKNTGMAKATVPHARNPIILKGFMDVWSEHVNKMSTYHSFVLPIENLNKVFNYTGYASSDDSISVETILRGAYGESVNDYIKTFIQDLNGGVKVQGSGNFVTKAINKFKKTAVAGSLSVVVQQPTAVVRAMAMINLKYFAHKTDGMKHKDAWEELKKYAPVAIIKEMGGFDVGGGKQVAEYITAKEYKGIKAKAKGWRTDSTYRDESLMWGASKADEFGWITIWSAVKKEIADTTTFKVGSEEFLQACGERFTEVIDYTQVYDSVISRSGFMRNKGEISKMATAFMGEPTTSFNMLYNAVLQAKRGSISGRKAGRIIGYTMFSVFLAAIAKSLIYALRDDDDDESYAEKYAQALTDSLISDMHIHNMLPYVNDIVSIFSGWDVERTDMAILKDFKDAIDGLDSSDKSDWRKVEDLAGAVAAFGGLPVKNVMRTVREMRNFMANLLDDNTASADDVGDAIVETITGETSASDINEALEKGNTTKAKNIINDLVDDKVKQGKTEKEAKASIKASVTGYWKELYLQAYRDNNSAEMLRIRQILQSTGLYDNVIETCQSWIKSMKDEKTSDTKYKKW